MNRRPHTSATLSLGFSVAGLLAVVDARPAVAADAPKPLAVLECRERLGLPWPRALVTYQIGEPDGLPAAAQPEPGSPGQVKLATGVRPDQVRLVDAAGNEVPCQLSRVRKGRWGGLTSARLSFFAELPADGAYRFELRKGKPAAAAAAAAPTASAADGCLVLDNGLTALRLPAPGEHRFKDPLRFGQAQAEMVALYGRQAAAGVAPGPLQGVRLADGRWVGGSYFFAADPAAAPKVTGYRCRVTEQGPLFVEAEVEYRFDRPLSYRMTVRLLAGDPAAEIDEQYDFGPPGNLWEFRLMVSLAAAAPVAGAAPWKPDVAYFFAPRFKQSDAAFAERLKAAGIASKSAGAADFGSVRLDYGQAAVQVLELAARYPWHPNAYFFGLVDATALPAAGAGATAGPVPFIGIVPVHAGNWRASTGASDAMLWSYAGGDVCLNWPLRTPAHPRSALHTGEYDPAQPLSSGRRQWLLVAGPFQTPDQLYGLRLSRGWVGLDDYKDWILDWPADPAVTYPRLLFSREDVARLKPRLDTLPGAETLKSHLYFQETDARREQLWRALGGDSVWAGPRGMARGLVGAGDPPNMPWATSFRFAQMAGWAGDVDELLSSDGLAPERREQLRRWLAAACYVVSEPDVNPRGSMTHLGNPNMPINRFCALPFMAALIPDHPRAQEWLDVSAKYIRYKLAMNTAPGGAWSELITYYAASAPHIMQSACVLARTGRLDEATARLTVAPALFTTGLLTPPDPRFAARLVPGWGHEGTDNVFHFLVAAIAIRDVDPALARALVWSWDRSGRIISGHHDAGFSPRAQLYGDLLADMPADYLPPQLASQWYPGFGVTLRAHAGSPDETYLSLRNGYNCSHSDANQGDFVLYARGAPLVALALMGYPLHQHPPFQELDQTFGWHSRVRFGQPGNTGGWPGGGAYGGVPAHAFSDTLDYARAVGDYGPQRWTRQMLLLKARQPGGPDYFLVRDSADPVDGDAGKLEPKWWALRTVGRKEQVKLSGNEIQYASAFGARLTAHFLQPATVSGESRDAARDSILYMGVGDNWRQAGSPVKGGGSNPVAEDWLTITSMGPVPAGEDVLVALVPTAKGEAAPQCELLAPGAAKVTTRDGTDYVFVDRSPLKVAAGDVAFDGIAGAVRVFADEVHLVVAEGPATVTYKGVTLRSPVPAVKIVPVAELGKPQTIEVPDVAWKLPDAPLPAGCRTTGRVRCELRIEHDRIGGRSEGLGGFLYVPMPPGMSVLPMLIVDGQTYAPGTSGGELIVPLMPGGHTFEVRALEQPPVFHNWQAW